MFNPWVLLVLLSAFVANGFYWNAHGSNAENKRLTLKYSQEKVAALHSAREKEQLMEVKVNEALARQTEELADVQRHLDATIISLRNRTPRSATLPDNPIAACSGVTGRELSSEDAEFLAREAARADTIRAGLNTCYAAYDQITIGLENE